MDQGDKLGAFIIIVIFVAVLVMFIAAVIGDISSANQHKPFYNEQTNTMCVYKNHEWNCEK